MRITKRCFVTGGCGFIGSHLVDRLMKDSSVTVYDNLSSGKKEYIQRHFGKKGFRFIKADLLDKKKLIRAISGADIVFHMAANPDIRIGQVDPEVDFRQGAVATYNLLEAMRLAGVKKIVFASSSTVFGETKVRPTPEDYAPMQPISVYGANKLACEGMISAYCHMFGMQAWILRFANIVGSRGTHGILVDFMRKLEKSRKQLEVLGNGKQRKSYLLVEDLVDGMLFALEHAKQEVNIFNLGTQDDIKISEIAGIVLERMGLSKKLIRYTGGIRGWPGDVALMLLDTSKMRRLGWRVRYGSRHAVTKAADDLIRERYGRPR
jgi:UDP-glucose 4-epimerase